MTKSVGLLGGSFNPVHKGHVALAEAVQKICRFEPLWIIPAKSPPHKPAYEIEEKDRVEMTRLAFEHVPGAKLSLFEIESEGTSYAIRTIEHFTRAHAGSDLSFVIGADAFHDIPKWYAFPDVMEACSYVIAARAGWDQQPIESPQSKLSRRLSQLEKAGLLRASDGDPGPFQRVLLTRSGTRIQILNVSLPEVNSTEVRLRMQLSENVDDLVPSIVVNYLKSKAPYGSRVQ